MATIIGRTKLIFGVGPYEYSVYLEGDHVAALNDWTCDVCDKWDLKVYFEGEKKWHNAVLYVETVPFYVDDEEEVMSD